MNNVKDKHSATHLQNECREPWTLGCPSFVKVEATCVVTESCTWKCGKGRNAFTSSIRTNIETAKYLLADKDFSYFLSAIDADEALEKFFGKTRMQSCRNFYIDVIQNMDHIPQSSGPRNLPHKVKIRAWIYGPKIEVKIGAFEVKSCAY